METVKVKAEVVEGNPNGYIVINEEDFVEGEHELFVEGEESIEKAPAKMTVEELKEFLESKSIAYTAEDKKADLLALAEAA